MANTIVLGMQWGDEGKGKIVDLICPAFDAVARFQGGHNAGHTVKFADRHFALHLLPSGILHPGVTCILGNGMVIYPEAFLKELEEVTAAGVDAQGRLWLSDRAQVILPVHVALDGAREQALGKQKIGTTIRGIGPSYEGKAARYGLRLGDLQADDLEAKLERLLAWLSPELASLEADPPPTVAELVTLCRGWAERLKPYLQETSGRIHDLLDDGRSILFEGAQGALLDIDHGTYPYVTSSNATAGGACTGTGVPPTQISGALGVLKAYTTRVGGGPFVTELHDDTGEHLRRRGNEFGTTTGRPRRCGWLDAVAARHSRRLNGIGTIALTKLDVLDELDEIQMCVGYRYRGERLRHMPTRLDILSEVEPEYRSFPGWKTPTVGILDVADLPAAARDYIAALEQEVGAPVGLVSTGPRREETILIDRPEVHGLLGDRTADVLRHRDGG